MTGYQSKKAMAQAKLDSMEREALKMALEALKYAASMGHGRMVRGMFAPFTIKEALAVHPRKAQGEEHMTGYQSKKAAARDKLAHMTFEQRCRVSEQCLPEAPYRAMLVALHDEMLEALAQPEQEPIREVLKQVLELTESMVLHCDAELNQHDVNVIVAKGIEALAQPPLPVQEPIVGTKTWFEDGKVVTQHLTAKDIYKEPAQEPVAFEEWLSKQHGDPEEIGFLQALRIAYISGQDSIITPPQRPWVGLTAEEAAECWTTSATQTWKNFESKLKEKNNGT